MKIDLSDQVGGQTLRRIRDFFRKFERYHVQAAQRFFGLTEHDAAALLWELEQRGYLRIDPLLSRDQSKPLFVTTQLGGQIRSSKALKRIPRAKADEILEKLARKIREINARDELLYRVAEARIFGSYLGEAEDLGDVDIAVRLEHRRNLTTDQFVEAALARADLKRKTGIYAQRLGYADQEVRQLITSVSRHLSVHDISELLALNTPSKSLEID